MYQGGNLFQHSDLTDGSLVRGVKVFLSHRLSDKPIVRAIASILSALNGHYWLDEQDEDFQRASALVCLGIPVLFNR